jgi:hypothetical protein
LQDQDQQKLASYLTFQVREDRSEVYGEGFRDALSSFQVVGLKALIEHAIATGRIS